MPCLEQEEIEDIIKITNNTVDKAKKIDYELQNIIYPELGDKFEQNLLEEIELIVKGYQDNNEEMALKGKELVQAWTE